jgi:hypothetical protein
MGSLFAERLLLGVGVRPAPQRGVWGSEPPDPDWFPTNKTDHH